MGATPSKDPEDGGDPLQDESIPEHPLLVAIENPINRFFDDFASTLVDIPHLKLSKNETPFANNEIEEIEGYTIIKKIGEGADASVFEGIKEGETVSVALKIFNKKDKQSRNEAPKEVEICQNMNHPYIIKIIDAFRLPNDDFVVTMPIARKGALKSSHYPVLTVNGAIKFLDQIGNALAYMHKSCYVHRDIKPGNILVFDDGFKLCDFSVSTKLSLPDQVLSLEVGTSYFMAPEVTNNGVYLPMPADMWSLGITVFLLLYGSYPYNLEKVAEQADPNKHICNIARLQPLCELSFPETPIVPDQLKEIISKLLRKNPEERMTAEELANNEWIHDKREEWEALIKKAQC